MNIPHASSVWSKNCKSRCKPGDCSPWSRHCRPAWGAIHRRRHDCGQLGVLTRFESPRQLDEVFRPDPLRIFQWGAAAAGLHHQSRQHPCPTCPRRRGLGILLPRQSQAHLQLRLEKLPKPIQDISWKAQVRLCKRHRRLLARGKNANQVVVALARELVGFMWAIAKDGPVTP
jgi:transposase